MNLGLYILLINVRVLCLSRIKLFVLIFISLIELVVILIDYILLLHGSGFEQMVIGLHILVHGIMA